VPEFDALNLEGLTIEIDACDSRYISIGCSDFDTADYLDLTVTFPNEDASGFISVLNNEKKLFLNPTSSGDQGIYTGIQVTCTDDNSVGSPSVESVT
jgi:hypothetical protein